MSRGRDFRDFQSDYFFGSFNFPPVTTGIQSQIGEYGRCCVNVIGLFKSESPAPLQVQPTSLLQTSGYRTADSVQNLKFPMNQR
jgi:hypothetical protein